MIIILGDHFRKRKFRTELKARIARLTNIRVIFRGIANCKKCVDNWACGIINSLLKRIVNCFYIRVWVFFSYNAV